MSQVQYNQFAKTTAKIGMPGSTRTKASAGTQATAGMKAKV
jgi:hypothetical protein